MWCFASLASPLQQHPTLLALRQYMKRQTLVSTRLILIELVAHHLQDVSVLILLQAWAMLIEVIPHYSPSMIDVSAGCCSRKGQLILWLCHTYTKPDLMPRAKFRNGRRWRSLAPIIPLQTLHPSRTFPSPSLDDAALTVLFGRCIHLEQFVLLP